MVDEVAVRGILQTRDSWVAMIAAPNGSINCSAQGRLMDGNVHTITGQSEPLTQEVKDPVAREAAGSGGRRVERQVMVRNFFSVAALLALAIASTLTADVDRHAPPLTSVARAELRTISTRLEGALSQVLIEASEPVAYVTSQPDPLTVLVDLRNVKPGMLPPGILGPLPPVADVRVEGPGRATEQKWRACASSSRIPRRTACAAHAT